MSCPRTDPRALPAPDTNAYASRGYEAPQGRAEETIAAIWQELLGLHRLGRYDNFFDLGGHSLLALQALARVNESMNAAIKITDIYKNPTIHELAGRLRGAAVDDPRVDLSQEADLDDTIVPCPVPQPTSETAILLSGGTGFVGRFLLAQVLAETDAKVYCLVRARTIQQAYMRLRTVLENWDLWHEEFARRIVAVPGDLRLPRLGIDDTTYEMLARTVDCVYHCATSMNHLETYTMAKAANVESSRELLRLATYARPKLINYVSTLGVFSSATTAAPRIVHERTTIDHEVHCVSRGYVASKWVGEKIFLNAGAREVPCNIFRLGLVWADTQQGRYDELQREYRLLKSCLMSGYGIENYQYEMPPTPVDYVARAIVLLARRHRQGKGIFHISSTTQQIEGVFERCNETAETTLELLPFHKWVKQMMRLHRQGNSLAIVPLIESAASLDEHSLLEHMRARRGGGLHFDCSTTHRELEKMGLTAPVVNDELLVRCVADMLSRDEELKERLAYRGARMFGRGERQVEGRQ
jgi:myxalamid-type nonribosomal peptide synthetase MxaA